MTNWKEVAAELLPLAEAWAAWLDENRDEIGHYKAADAVLIVERARGALSATPESENTDG